MASQRKSPKPKVLGRKTALPESPEQAVRDRIVNKNRDHKFTVRFTCPEFTALCPITGQPDFAHFVLDYVPGEWLIESKSLKFYFSSFRNFGVFHEECTIMIARRVIEIIVPHWLRLSGFWYPRGGMPIDVWYQTSVPPDGVHVPDPGVSPYRGRG